MLGGLRRSRIVTSTVGLRGLLAAQVVSVTGSQVTLLALPTLAVLQLDAGPGYTSALATAAFLPAALFGPFIGVMVDRAPLRAVLVGSDLFRAAVLATIPLAAAFDAVSLAQLLVVAALVGMAVVPFDAAAATMVPRLVGPDKLSRANSLVMGAQAIGRISGPGLGGVLVTLLGAATAIAADVASYGLSVVLLLLLLPAFPARQGLAPMTFRSLLREAREGVSVVRADPVLSRGILGTAMLNLGGAGIGGLIALYAYEEVGLRPSELGLALALGSLGTLAGALLAPRVERAVGTGTAVFGLSSIAAGTLFLIPTATLGAGFALLAVYELGFGFAAAGWGVLLATLRQRRSPQEALGRVNALGRAAALGTFPLGTAFAATVAETAGIVPALLCLCAIACSAPMLYASRSFRRAANVASIG